MSELGYVVVVPTADDKPLEVRRLSDDGTLYEQAKQLIGDGTESGEVVYARGLRELGLDSSPVMLVDSNGHPKDLDLNRRAGDLYGGQIAGTAVICAWPLWPEGDLEGFTLPEARELLGLLEEAGAGDSW